MSKIDDLKGKVEDKVSDVRGKYEGDVNEARSELKDLWANNVVFRALVYGAAALVLILLAVAG